MKINRHFYAVAGLICVLAAMSAAGSSAKKASPPAQPVFVTNTSASPVPTVAQGTTAVSGTVSLSNTTASPLPVRDVTLASRTPVRFSAGVIIANGNFEEAGSDAYVVPTGKRLVVQTLVVSSFQVPTGQKLNDVSLSQKFNESVTIPIQYQGTDDDGYEHFKGALSGTIYYEAGAVLRAVATRSDTAGIAVANIIVNGYLESA